MRQGKRALAGLGGLGLLLTAAVIPAQAQQLTNQTFQTNVNIEVLPFAELTFQGGNLLYLEIPPEDSTSPGSGVNFIVTGNADATLIAEPDAFVQVVTEEDGLQHLGKAVLGSDAVGYKLDLFFPRAGVTGGSPSGVESASLPGNVPGPTAPPLVVDLSSTGHQRTGVLHMATDPNWTPSGGIPLPGVYVGEVTMTLTASD